MKVCWIAVAFLLFLQLPKQDLGVKLQFTYGGQTFLSLISAKELAKDKWRPGDMETKSVNTIVESATNALATCVIDAEDWVPNEISFRQHDDTESWYWVVLLSNAKSGGEAILGVRLNGESFAVVKE